jgi:hypothetical protein
MSPTDEADDLLTEAGARWRAGQPSPPEPDLDRIVRSKKPRRRWVVPALAAASVAVIATATLVFLPDKDDQAPTVAQGKQSAGIGPLSSAAPAAVKKHPLQVRNGDRVQVDGQVIAAPGKPVVYCIPVATDLPAIVGEGPKAPKCEPGAELTLTGVAVDKLPQLTTVQGVQSGFAHLEGIWTDGTIAVDKQGPVVEDRPDGIGKVPCAAPAGGWKPGNSNDLVTPAVAAFVDARPTELQEISIGWPNGIPADGAPTGPSVLMIGVAHGDLAQIRQLVAPLVKGGNLCVRQVKLSKSEIEKIRNQVAAIPASALQPLSYGGGVGDHPVNIDLRILDDKAVAALEPLGLDNLTIETVIRPAT